MHGMDPYWRLEAMQAIRQESRKKWSEVDAGASLGIQHPVKEDIRFVVRKFGTLLITVGRKLEHRGYPHVSSRYR